MASETSKHRIPILQGTLDLMVLRTLAAMGPQHAYAIATRLEQISEDLLSLNQGTLYPALVRLEQQGWIQGSWGKTENNREAKFYAITRAGRKALGEETARWRRLAGLMEKLLAEPLAGRHTSSGGPACCKRLATRSGCVAGEAV